MNRSVRKSFLFAALTIVLALLTACGGEPPADAEKPVKSAPTSASPEPATPSARPAPTTKLCTGPDVAVIEKALGAKAKVNYDLVAGQTPPEAKAALAAPECELEVGAAFVTYRIDKGPSTMAQEKLTATEYVKIVAADGAKCGAPATVTLGGFEAVTLSCKHDFGDEAQVGIVVDDWTLECSVMSITAGDRTGKVAADACLAMATRLAK